MSQSKLLQFAVGWLKQSKGGKQYISGVANGKLQKIKLQAQLEDGSTVAINNFAVFFSETKPSEKAPDVQFVFEPVE